jgi:hypothetical protein
MRIDSSGNVGIGTTSPAAETHISKSYSAPTGGHDSNLGLIVSNSSTANSYAGVGIAAGNNAASFIHFGDTDDDNVGALNYFHSSDSFTFVTASTQKMVINSLGNVGIGTASPGGSATAYDGGLLHINQSAGSKGSQLRLTNTATGTGAGDGSFISAWTDNGLYITNQEAAGIHFSANGSERMRINSSGNVGIGTTSPVRALQVGTHGSGNGEMALASSTTGNCSILMGDGAGGSDFYRGYIQYQNGNDLLAFATAATERVVIDSSGNVGIGNSAPGYKLSVLTTGTTDTSLHLATTGGASANGDATNSVRFTGGTNTRWANAKYEAFKHIFHANGVEKMRLDSSGKVFCKGSQLLVQSSLTGFNTNDGLALITDGNSDKYVWNYESTSLRFGTANTERMRIDSSGNVLIGATALDARGVRIFGNGSNGLYVKTTATCHYWITNDGAGTGAGTIATIYNDTTVAGSITVNGNATAYNENSDYRLKENVVDISDGISRLKQLKPRRFNFIIDPEITVDGFIAHEAQAVVPQSVTGTKDEVDKDGNPVMQGIDKSKLVPLLTAALQEAIAKIETLEAKVAALEAG